jgi:hypothetical protein
MEEGSAINLVTSEAEKAGQETEDSIVEWKANNTTDHGENGVYAFYILVRAGLVEHSQESYCYGYASNQSNISQ